MSKINFYGVLATSKGETFYGFDCKEKRDKWLNRPIPNATKGVARYRPIKISLKMKKGQHLEFADNGKVSIVGKANDAAPKKKAIGSPKKEKKVLVLTTPDMVEIPISNVAEIDPLTTAL